MEQKLFEIMIDRILKLILPEIIQEKTLSILARICISLPKISQ